MCFAYTQVGGVVEQFFEVKDGAIDVCQPKRDASPFAQRDHAPGKLDHYGRKAPLYRTSHRAAGSLPGYSGHRRGDVTSFGSSYWASHRGVAEPAPVPAGMRVLRSSSRAAGDAMPAHVQPRPSSAPHYLYEVGERVTQRL